MSEFAHKRFVIGLYNCIEKLYRDSSTSIVCCYLCYLSSPELEAYFSSPSSLKLSHPLVSAQSLGFPLAAEKEDETGK